MDTKRMFADSLKGLLSERALGDITVQDIVAESGLSRSTFYKHFEDKYDLAGWMLPGDELFELASSIDGSSYEAVLADALALIDEWQPIYANAIDVPYEELLYNKIFGHTLRFYERAFTFTSRTDGSKIEAVIEQLAIKQITDFLLNWVTGKYDLAKDEVFEILTRLWPEDLFC